MKQFQYIRAANQKAAISSLTKSTSAQFIAGGTNLIDLMKRGITSPDTIIDINSLPLRHRIVCRRSKNWCTCTQ